MKPATNMCRQGDGQVERTKRALRPAKVVVESRSLSHTFVSHRCINPRSVIVINVGVHKT